MIEYFQIEMIDYKLDKMVEFTTRGKLTRAIVNGKSTACITNEYDVPIIIAAPSVLIRDSTGKLLY